MSEHQAVATRALERARRTRRVRRRLAGHRTQRTAQVIGLIPAHNEADCIAATLRSVLDQTRTVDKIYVVADNCTDDTAEIAARYADVIVTKDNRDKKAGALNQALEILLPELADDDAVLVMDADTTVTADFVAESARVLTEQPRVGGVSSIFLGRDTRNVLGLMQAMEFYRYRRQIRRNGNRAYVLSGTASVLRVSALRAVKAGRGSVLPSGGGSYYDTHSLTEDNEMTFALLLLGYQCVAPGIVSTTDVMPTVPKLFRQRHRWYLGALRNIRGYGRRMPWYMRFVYWRQQAGLFVTFFGLLGYLVLATLLPRTYLYAVGLWTVIAVGLLAIERVSTVWRMGWRARLVAAALVPEQLYAMLLTATYASALKDFVLGRKGAWHAT